MGQASTTYMGSPSPATGSRPSAIWARPHPTWGNGDTRAGSMAEPCPSVWRL